MDQTDTIEMLLVATGEAQSWKAESKQRTAVVLHTSTQRLNNVLLISA